MHILIFSRHPFIIRPADVDHHSIKNEIIRINDTSTLDGIEIRLMQALAAQGNFQPEYLYVIIRCGSPLFDWNIINIIKCILQFGEWKVAD